MYGLDDLQNIPDATGRYFSWVKVILAESGTKLVDGAELWRSSDLDQAAAGGRLHSDSHSVYRSKRSQEVKLL